MRRVRCPRRSARGTRGSPRPSPRRRPCPARAARASRAASSRRHAWRSPRPLRTRRSPRSASRRHCRAAGSRLQGTSDASAIAQTTEPRPGSRRCLAGAHRAHLHEDPMHDWKPPVSDDIRARTSDRANAKIDQMTRGAVDEAAEAPDRIPARLAELDREWNVDRALMLNFAITAAISSALAIRNLSRTGKLGGWGALFYTQLGFLAYHAAKRWCPPMPLFRRLGYRSDREICAERAALTAQPR